MNIAILIRDYYISAWQYEAIEKSLQINMISPAVIILNSLSTQNNQPKTYQFIKKLNQFIFNSFVNWERKRCFKNSYINELNDATKQKDIRKLLPNTPIIEFSNDIKAIKQYELDVIFCQDRTIITQDIYNIPTHGVWYYEFVDLSPLSFWELYHNKGFINTILQRHTKNNTNIEILAFANIPVNEQGSLCLTTNRLAWELSPLLSICLDKLIKYQSPYVSKTNDANAVPGMAIGAGVKSGRIPNFVITCNMFLKMINKRLKTSSKSIEQHWTIQVSKMEHQPNYEKLNQSYFEKLKESPGTYWADPFLFCKENKEYLFFEEFSYQTKRGVIKVAELNGQGFKDPPITILNKNFHYSYPTVFVDNETIYLVPEQAQSKEIALYRCVEFPHKWEKAATLIENGHFYDPVIFKNNDIWWLFFVEKMSSCGEGTVYGKLWYADSLFGPWQEHPKSPISTDCRFSRSAGSIFIKDQQIIRPVQDCSFKYGYKINYLKIKVLSKSDYEDELIGTTSPNPFNVDGIHTINFTQKSIVIDTRTRFIKPENDAL